ncbi:hypothetical protein PMAYCL1PPCAC_25046, partial [Pristionchus mayeri]
LKMELYDSAFLNFDDKILIKIIGFLPMEDRINVRASCTRLEKIAAETDLVMDRYTMHFYLFDGSPMSTPFGVRDQGMDSNKLEEFTAARARLTKRIRVPEVVLHQIDFEKVDFESVKCLLSNCDFDTVYIVQQNVMYEERVETLIEEFRGKKIVLSALYFPYVDCIEKLPAEVELRFNYLLKNKIPAGGGKHEDLLLELVKKGHSLLISVWSTPMVVKDIFEILDQSDHDQLVAIKTFDLAAFCTPLGVEKTVEGGYELRGTQGAHKLRRIRGRRPDNSFWSFSHSTRQHVMTDGEALLWLSNRPFRMEMDTCPMHCGLCESAKSSQEGEMGDELCDRCPVCRCVCFKRF